MKGTTARWLNAWKIFLIILAGIPTLGLTWFYLVEQFDQKYSSNPSRWELIAVKALEPWLHFWRGVLLFIAGFLTFGYTWSLMASFDEPFLMGLRKNYEEKDHNC